MAYREQIYGTSGALPALGAPAERHTAAPRPFVDVWTVSGLFAVAALAFWLVAFVWRFTPRAGTWGTLDLSAYFYPKFAYGTEALLDGRLPLWNPHEFCGMPFLAAAQVAALYPVKNLVFWLFAPPFAVHANYLVHLVIAAVAAWDYARWLRLAPAAAALAGVLWAFQGGFLGSVYHPNRIMVLAWVPLVFLLYERALARRTVGAAALAGGVVALATSAGYPGFVLCLGGLLALATIFHTARAWRAGNSTLRTLAAAAGTALFAITLAAPQILPLVEMVGESTRETLVASMPGVHGATPGVSSVLGTMARMVIHLQFHTGAAVGLAMVGMIFGRRRLGWLFAALLVFVFTSDALRPLPAFRLLRYAPAIWEMFTPFFYAMLIALGLDAVTRRRRTAWAVPALLLGLPLVTMAEFAALGIASFAGPLGLLVGVAALAAERRPAGARIVAALVAAVWVAGTLATLPYRRGAEPYPATMPDPQLQRLVKHEAPAGRLFAPSLVRVGHQMLSGVPVVSGYEASLRPRRVGALLDAAGLRDSLIDMAPDWPKIAGSRHLLDLLGVALLVSPLDLTPFGLEPGPPLPDGFRTYRNPTALPRAFLVHRVRAVTSAEDAYAAVVDRGFRPGEEAVVEGAAPVFTAADVNGSANIDLDHPEHVSVVVTTPTPALLVLTDSWFPGWEASEGTVAHPILRTDYAFRGVALEAGVHRIDFRYRAPAFRLGTLVAAAALVVALAAVARERAHQTT
jgi:hypothetical protein